MSNTVKAISMSTRPLASCWPPRISTRGEGFLLEERFGRHDRVIAGQRAEPDGGRLRRRKRRGLPAESGWGQIGSQQPPARDRGRDRGGPAERLASCEHISPLPPIPAEQW